MFSGEHTPLMKSVHWLSQQAVHTIGMHVSSKCQVTDTRFSALGKAEQRRRAPVLRARMRKLAVYEGAAAVLLAKHTEVLHLVLAMHERCVADCRDNDSVVKAFRACG